MRLEKKKKIFILQYLYYLNTEKNVASKALIISEGYIDEVNIYLQK